MTQSASLQGKTVLITGATDGLGKAVAQMAAQAGARVLLHGRNRKKLDAVRMEIAEATGNQQIEGYLADLASLEEVRELAEAVQAKHPKLDVLLNNAGVGLFGEGQARRTSEDGYELHFAVNHLAPFLLTHLLLPALEAAANPGSGRSARIVNVASIGQAPVDFRDVMLERSYDGRRAYSQSKLAQIMFTIDLAEKLKGSGVTVTALHPATLMSTPMVTSLGIPPRSTVMDGAEPTFRLIASPEVEGVSGVYFDQFEPAKPNAQADDASVRMRLWALSVQLCGLPVS